MDARELLHAYVEAHNGGVRTGDFSALVALLDADCVLRFEGIATGPFMGKVAVAGAFRDDPPGAELHVGEVSGDADAAEALYGWVGAAARFSGTLRVEAGAAGIRNIRVHAFGR